MSRPVKLVSQKRTGLFPEHNGIAPVVYETRATIPAIEALREAGATIVAVDNNEYQITLGPQMPKGIVAVDVFGSFNGCIRMEHEPEYPMGEHPNYWRQVDFTPCPVCGAPVVWYEAGYVPGYRVCTGPKHHHSLAK